MTLIFRPSRAAVCISMKLNPAAPSPLTQTTSRDGLPSFAPMAEGMPVPSIPSSRMFRNDRGFVDPTCGRSSHQRSYARVHEACPVERGAVF
jgi:hypothetical protein